MFIPGVGGCTIYSFGDVRKIRDPKTEICVRVHDECIGSDVFCSDICTCRPYLIFALQQCVQCAQRGGVGIVIYYRKEGRSLGEVIKFRVYNARENQEGGRSYVWSCTNLCRECTFFVGECSAELTTLVSGYTLYTLYSARRIH